MFGSVSLASRPQDRDVLRSSQVPWRLWRTAVPRQYFTQERFLIRTFNYSVLLSISLAGGTMNKHTQAKRRDKHTLYYHGYSICSLQVLYTIAIAAQKTCANQPTLEVEKHAIDIFNEAQLEEHFLTNINPKGQVSYRVLLARHVVTTKCSNCKSGACPRLPHFGTAYSR
jgi:hypothetical protein